MFAIEFNAALTTAFIIVEKYWTLRQDKEENAFDVFSIKTCKK